MEFSNSLNQYKQDRLDDMAKFVVHLGFKPSEYFALTMEQRTAIVAEWNRTNKKRG